MQEHIPQTPEIPVKTPPPPMQWGSMLQMSLSILGALTLFSLAAAIMLTTMSSELAAAGMSMDTASALLFAVGPAAGGLLLLPSAWYAFRRLVGRPDYRNVFQRSTYFLILLVPPILVVGDLASSNPDLSWWLLPPLHVLAVALPIAWLLALARRGLPKAAPQRNWGIFASGLTLGPVVVLILELLAGLAIFILVMIYINQRPGLLEELEDVANRLMYAVQVPGTIERILAPYLAKPGVIYIVLAFGAGVVPIIEEIVKPIGVWLLAGRKPSRWQGFTAGIISGAGFALFENLSIAGQAAADIWSTVVFARMGTSLVHIATAGLVGMALAEAWSKGRYLRLGGAYLGAVIIHALWNGMVLTTAIAEMPMFHQVMPAWLTAVSEYSVYGLSALVLVSFVLLMGMNNRLSRAIISPAPSEHSIPEESKK